MMAVTSSGLFKLLERVGGGDKPVTAVLSLDDFVRIVNSMGPQKAPRITKNEAAFAKQLSKGAP